MIYARKTWYQVAVRGCLGQNEESEVEMTSNEINSLLLFRRDPIRVRFDSIGPVVPSGRVASRHLDGCSARFLPIIRTYYLTLYS